MLKKSRFWALFLCIALIAASTSAFAAISPAPVKKTNDVPSDVPSDVQEYFYRWGAEMIESDFTQGDTDFAEVKALLDAMDFQARFSTDDTLPGYLSFIITILEEAAFSLDLVTDEDNVYVRTPLLGDTILKLDGNAALGFLQAMDAEGYFDSLNAMYDKAFEFPELEAQIASWDVEPLIEIVDNWCLEVFSNPNETTDVSSAFDAPIANATYYQITKTEISALLEKFIPELLNREALLKDLVAASMEGYSASQEEIDAALLQLKLVLATAPYTIPQSIPDDFYLLFANCYDENGQYAAGMIDFYLPIDGEEIYAFAEWLPTDGQFYIYGGDGYQGFSAETWFIMDDTGMELDAGLVFRTYDGDDEIEDELGLYLYGGVAEAVEGYLVSISGAIHHTDRYGDINGGSFTLEYQFTDPDDQLFEAAAFVNVIADSTEYPLMEYSFALTKEPGEGIPFDVNAASAKVYDIFNQSPEDALSWLEKTLAQGALDLEETFEGLVDRVLEEAGL